MKFFIIQYKGTLLYVQQNEKRPADYSYTNNIQNATWFASGLQAKEFAEGVMDEQYEIHVLDINIIT